MDDILTDDDSVDYSSQQQPLEPQIQVETPNAQTSEAEDTSTSNPETVTDSSIDSSSIEVLQPNTGLEIQLPINPPLRQPPPVPDNLRTNVTVPNDDSLLTEDEDTGDQVVPPAVGAQTAEKGRTETLSPTPQNTQSVCSAIELTVNDLAPSEQGITDKCCEIDFQLSNHPDWNQPNHSLRNDLCEVLPILYQLGFNTEGFPNLEKCLYETVGRLPYQSLLRIALHSVFEEFPEISAIQTKVYRMVKCHLSIINHTSVTQFDDITLSNHNFDTVAGADLHSVSGPEGRPDLSLQTDLNETYYSVFSQAQRQVYRVTKKSLDRIQRDRANSCPDLVLQANREVEEHSNSGWRHTTPRVPFIPIPDCLQTDQQTQTLIPNHYESKIQVHSIVHLLTAVTVTALIQIQT